jgi:hypothetical protein
MTSSQRWKRHALWGFLAIVSVLLLRLAFEASVLFLVMDEDRRCFYPEHARTRREIESCLSLYTTDDCASDRIPSFDYDAGLCVGYRVGGVEPIHVLYDVHDRMILHISAYE